MLLIPMLCAAALNIIYSRSCIFLKGLDVGMVSKCGNPKYFLRIETISNGKSCSSFENTVNLRGNQLIGLFESGE